MVQILILLILLAVSAAGQVLQPANGGTGVTDQTYSGSTHKVATTTGTLTNTHCVMLDASGNFVDAGAACSGGSGTVTNVATTSPISGGPITTTGTISCPTCAIGPGASTANHLATFLGTDGITLADGGAIPTSSLTGQTTNYLPLATSATASTTSSIVEQSGTTSVVIHTTGTAYGVTLPEGTALTATAGNQIINSNSTSHTLDLSSNGGAFSPICTAANGQCTGAPPQLKQYTFVADSTATSVTSPSITITSGDLLVVSCRFGTGTTGTATDSRSNSYTAITAQKGGSVGIQISWAIAAASGSTTFTCTQSSSVAGISLVMMEFSGVGSTANTSSGTSGTTTVTSTTVPAFTTSQRTLIVQCSAIGALVLWTQGNMGGGTGVIGGVAQSSQMATNADQGCQYRVVSYPLSSVTSTLTNGSGGNWATSLLAFNY